MKKLFVLLFSFALLLMISPPTEANIINQHKGKILKEKVFVQSDVVVSDAVMVFENSTMNVGINEQTNLFINIKVKNLEKSTKQLFKWQGYPLQCYIDKSMHLRKLNYTEIGYSIKS